jgi:hypothetical protein
MVATVWMMRTGLNATVLIITPGNFVKEVKFRHEIHIYTDTLQCQIDI